MKNAHREFVPRHSMPSGSHQIILNFWLKEENSIISNDRRNGRDVVRMPKSTYLSKYGGLSDPNIEEDILLKKTNLLKHYVKHQECYILKAWIVCIVTFWRKNQKLFVTAVPSSSANFSLLRN